MAFLHAFTMAISILLQLSSLALVLCTPVHPHDPTITPPPLLKRHDDSRLIGYYWTEAGGEPYVVKSELSEDGYTITVSSNLVAFCPTTVPDWQSECSSSFYTTCTSAYLYAPGAAISCAPSETCHNNLIMTTIGESTTALRWWGCFTLFVDMDRVDPRTNPEYSTFDFYSSPASSSSPTTSSGSAVTALASGGVANTSPSNTQPTDSPAPASGTAPSEPASKVWMAGVVVGSVGFIAVVGMGFYLIQRRRQKTQEETYQFAPHTSTFSPLKPNGEGFITPLPPPGLQEGRNGSVSQTTGSNTHSMYSGKGNGAAGTQGVGTSIQDLPEFVRSAR